ncbi:MAG: hypothetical protein RLZZ84_9 [Pseudomonadota bacterium]|jgi:hypothetical protein
MNAKFTRTLICAMMVAGSLGGCAGGGATIQPDRLLFNIDSSYQQYAYGFKVEDTFDRTVRVFREGGYKLDVADRATGQISGARGRTGDRDAGDQKGLKFYALVLPGTSTGSEVHVKIVQIIRRSAVLNNSETELIVSDPQMYRYLFKRIESVGLEPELPVTPDAGTPTAP